MITFEDLCKNVCQINAGRSFCITDFQDIFSKQTQEDDPFHSAKFYFTSQQIGQDHVPINNEIYLYYLSFITQTKHVANNLYQNSTH